MRIDEDIEKFGAELRRKFNSMNVSVVLPGVRELVRTSIVRNFQAGGRYGSERLGGGGTKWVKSSRSGIEKGQTLRNKGILMNSIEIKVNAGNNKIQIIAGSNMPYARIHQFGFFGSETVKDHFRKRKGKKNFGKLDGKRKQISQDLTIYKVNSFTRNMRMPARPYLVIQQADIEEIGKLILRSLPRLIAGA